MKILLFGKDGQVGQELQRTLLPFGQLVALGRQNADLEDLAALEQLLVDQRPNVVVNAAAYTAVDKAEGDTEAAQRVNSEAVAAMARYVAASGSLLVHYSTDYVFDGEKAEPYSENDLPNPQNIYGATKLAGEQAIMDSGCKALIFRTSWVFSSQGANFIKTIVRLAKERNSLSIVADQVGAPTSAELIADVSALALAAFNRGALATSVYHLTASGKTSWHGLASYTIEQLLKNGQRLKLSPNSVRPISTAEYPLPAKRPKNSILNTGKLSGALGLELPPWQLHVDRCIRQLTSTDL